MSDEEKPKSKKKGKGNALRDAQIMELAMAGHTQSEIADRVGLRRQTVNRVLNSKEAQKLVDEARSGIKELLNESVATLSEALMYRSVDLKTAVVAALAILKGAGVLTEKTEVTVTKPYVMELIEGGRIEFGHRPVSEEEDQDGEED